MIRLIGIAGFIMTIAFSSCNGQVKKSGNGNADSTKQLFPKGNRVISRNFTGTVYLQMLVDADTTYHTNIGNVSFSPGARTNWHSHPGGQILLVTNGKGYYQEKGQPKRIIRAGDVVKCPPNVLHWHGATPADPMVHIAIGPNLDHGPVAWLEPVGDSVHTSGVK